MGWIIAILLIFFVLIILTLVFFFSFSLSDLLELDIVSKFMKDDDNEDENRKYLEKKERQIEQHLENIRRNQKKPKLTLNYEAGKIVDINKPLGKWTQLVTMTQLKYINNVKKLMGDKFSNKLGFWQIKVRAQSLSQGRVRGKGR